MIKVSLKDFAQTGKFGPVEVGMPKDEVISLLGEPDGNNDFNTGFGGLCYAWYEFFYSVDTRRITAMQNDHLLADHSNHKDSICFKNEYFELDTWFLEVRKNITYREIMEILQQEGIPFKEEVYWETNILRFESGVYLDFVDHDGEFRRDKRGHYRYHDVPTGKDFQDFALNGIRYFPTFRN